MIKKFIAIITVMMILSMALPVFAEEKSLVEVYTNGEKINFKAEGMPEPWINKDGRTLVPIRIISEKMMHIVNWDNKTKQAEIIGFDNEIILTVDKNTALVNHQKVQMDTKAIMKDGRVYVPLRFVSENFGAKVDYQSMNNIHTINITFKTGIEGWTAPVLKSTVTNDKFKNLEVLQDELGFGIMAGPGMGGIAVFNPYLTQEEVSKLKPMESVEDSNELELGMAILVMSSEDDDYDATIRFYGWNSGIIPGYQKVQPTARELFKLYLPNGYNKLFDLVDRSYTDKSLLNKRYVIDNREVELRYLNELDIYIGKPGIKYTYGWEIKK